MSDKIRIGVIGAGFGQQVHVPAFRGESRCEVVAICAKTLEHAKRVAENLGVPESYGDAREMLASRHVDAVTIAVPPPAQPDLVIAAAAAGKHIFCEKPLGMDVRGAQHALQAVQKAGVVHAIDFIFPEIGAWQQARSILEAGTLGKLRHVALSWRVETYAFATGRESWKTRAAEGGGTLNNFVSHSFYYLEWLFGGIERMATRIMPRGARAEARVDAWLDLASGAPITLSVAADAYLGSGHRIEIYGDEGTLLLENRTADYVNGFTLSVASRASRSFSTQPPEAFFAPDGRIQAVRAIGGRFIDAILSRGSVKPNLVDGVRVQQLIEACRSADRSGGWVSV